MNILALLKPPTLERLRVTRIQEPRMEVGKSTHSGDTSLTLTTKKTERKQADQRQEGSPLRGEAESEPRNLTGGL